MAQTFLRLVVLLSLILVPAFADTIATWDFSNFGNNVDLGASMVFAPSSGGSSPTITATAFNGGDLFYKNTGSGEAGLGLTGDPTGQNEIFHLDATGAAASDFIQLDVSALIAAGFTNTTFFMMNSTGGDAWQENACAVSGSLCSNATHTGGNDDGTKISVTLDAGHPFLDFEATSGNVLVAEFGATQPTTVPEPATLVLLGSALLAVSIRGRRYMTR